MNLKDRARAVLLHNRVESGGHRYTRPAPMTYEHQWLWDSCFHALVNIHFDPDMSKAELIALLSHQEREGPDAGMVPHMGYFDGSGTALWGRPHASTITQPPIIADAVLATYRATGDLHFVQELLPALTAYYDWLVRRRDPDGDGLISLIHPWEAGWDSSPRWDHYTGVDPGDDEGLKGWRHGLVAKIAAVGHSVAAAEAAGLYALESVDFNSLFAANLDSLGDLLVAVGQVDRAMTCRRRACRVRNAINAKMWDEAAGFYWDLDGRNETPIRVFTPAAFMTMYGGVPTDERAERLVSRLLDPAQFQAPFPVPSVSRSEPAYRPDAYWRGNVWAPANWLIIQGLRRYGYQDVADELTRRFVQLVETAGFREYFNPETGQGYGPQLQSWTTLVIDLLPNGERN